MGRRIAGKHLSARRAGLAAAAVLTAVAVAACATPGAAAPQVINAADTSQHTGTAARLAALLQQDVDAGAPGVVVRVNDGSGHVIALARQAPWTTADHTLSANDEFRMGSNTKTMISVLVLQLVAEHRLSLADPVGKWLPGLVPGGQHITLKMLLNHTSGLYDYIYDLGILAKEIGQDPSPVTPEQLLAVSAQYPPKFAPGTGYAYSNTDYVALGLVLEKATGQHVATLFQRRILGPLGLRDTYLAADGVSRDGTKLAAAYEPDAADLAPLLPPQAPPGTGFAGPARGDHVLVTALNPDYLWAAGAIVSTPADEQRFLRALASGELLPRAELAEMRTTVVEVPGQANSARYGLGFEEYFSPCGPVWGHTGGVAGYSSENYVDATGTRSVTVVTTTLFALHAPALGAADQKVVDAAVCAMLDKPIPAN